MSVVVMDKKPERPDVILELFRKREGFAHEAGAALAEGVIETFNMIGQTSVLADRAMTFGGKDFGVGLPEIGVEDGTLSILRR